MPEIAGARDYVDGVFCYPVVEKFKGDKETYRIFIWEKEERFGDSLLNC